MRDDDRLKVTRTPEPRDCNATPDVHVEPWGCTLLPAATTHRYCLGGVLTGIDLHSRIVLKIPQNRDVVKL